MTKKWLGQTPTKVFTGLGRLVTPWQRQHQHDDQKKTKTKKIIQFFKSSCTRLPAADVTGESQPNFHDLHHQVVLLMMIWWLGWFGDGVHDDLVIGDGGHFYDNIDEDNKLTSSNRSSPVTMGQLVTWIGFWEPYMCQSPLLEFHAMNQLCLEKKIISGNHTVWLKYTEAIKFNQHIMPRQLHFLD